MSSLNVVPPVASAELSRAQIADLKMRHGDELVRIKEGGETYVFRPPTRHEYARYTASVVRKREDILTPSTQLAMDCLVWPLVGEEPDQARLRGLFEKRVALPMQVASKLSDAAGGGDDVDVGKL